MTTFRNRIVFACLSLAGTAGLMSFSDPSSAASIGEARKATVVTADLNLAAAAGRATFDRRVAAAADQVCSQPTRTIESNETACRRDVLAQARRDAGIADVASN